MPEGPASAGISVSRRTSFDARVGERVVLRVALGLVVAPTHAEETLLPPRVLEGSDAVTMPQVLAGGQVLFAPGRSAQNSPVHKSGI